MVQQGLTSNKLVKAAFPVRVPARGDLCKGLRESSRKPFVVEHLIPVASLRTWLAELTIVEAPIAEFKNYSRLNLKVSDT